MTEPAPATTTSNAQPARKNDDTEDDRNKLRENAETAGVVAATTGLSFAIYELLLFAFRAYRSPSGGPKKTVEESAKSAIESVVESDSVSVDNVVKESAGLLQESVKPVSNLFKNVSVTVLVMILVILLATLILFWMFVSKVRAEQLELSPEDVENPLTENVEGRQQIKKTTIPLTDPLMIVAIIISMYSVSLMATLLIIIFNLFNDDWSWFPTDSIPQRFLLLSFGFFSLQSVFIVLAFTIFYVAFVCSRLLVRHNIHNSVGDVICRLSCVVVQLVTCVLTSLLWPTALFLKYVVGHSGLFDNFVLQWKALFELCSIKLV